MLEELDIKDFALVEHIRVPWTRGLNVLTGETGAGKSILIDALNVVLGGKVSPASIRIGAERAVIEATFQPNARITAWLKQQELLDEELPGLLVSREITKSSSRSRINGTLVNISMVQELRQHLLTIHTQHEARTLLSLQSQLEMLDGLGSEADKKLREHARTVYTRKRELQQQLKDFLISEDERLRRLDFARFQLRELEQACISDPLEDTSVDNQCRILANVAQLEALASNAYESLSGQEGEAFPSALDLVQKSLCAVESAQEVDHELVNVLDLLRTAQDNIEESSRTLRKYRDSLDTDPESLSQLEARLAFLATIKRKYGPTLSEAISRQEELSLDVLRLENAQSQANQIQEELSKVENELVSLTSELSSRRQVLADDFANLIEKELSALGMERCRFEIAFEATDIGPAGSDRVEVMISANPGQPLLPVAKIASGGELSRVMLAIKSIVAGSDQIPTVIFDEIDTGLSGRVLQSMRDKLARLARSHQILCITHQPIIASVADNYLLVNKEQNSTTTHITVAALQPDEKVKSLASMASGQEGQEVALNFAQSLYDEGVRLRSS